VPLLASVIVLNCIRQISSQTIPSIVGTWTYQGCFVDDPFRQLQHQPSVSGGMTVEACTSACQAAGYPLAGLEYASQCFCDSFLQGTNRFPDSQCNMVCTGNSAEFCGAGNRLQVYLDTSAPAPNTSACVSSNGEDSTPIAVRQDLAIPFRLNLLDVGVGGTHAFLLTTDTCASCRVESNLQNGDFYVLSSLYEDAAFVEFYSVTAGESPIARELFSVENTVFCAQINPVTGRIGPLVLAANGRSDLWALCPNTTAPLSSQPGQYRLDLVYSPVSNHPHYSQSTCLAVWLEMAWYDQVN